MIPVHFELEKDYFMENFGINFRKQKKILSLAPGPFSLPHPYTSLLPADLVTFTEEILNRKLYFLDNAPLSRL